MNFRSLSLAALLAAVLSAPAQAQLGPRAIPLLQPGGAVGTCGFGTNSQQPLSNGGLVSTQLHIGSFCTQGAIANAQPGYVSGDAAMTGSVVPAAGQGGSAEASAGWTDILRLDWQGAGPPPGATGIDLVVSVRARYTAGPGADLFGLGSLSTGIAQADFGRSGIVQTFSIDSAGNTNVNGTWFDPVSLGAAISNFADPRANVRLNLGVQARIGAAVGADRPRAATFADVQYLGLQSYRMHFGGQRGPWEQVNGGPVPFRLVGDYNGFDYVYAATPIPEPGTWALMAGGLLALGARARRRAERPAS